MLNRSRNQICNSPGGNLDTIRISFFVNEYRPHTHAEYLSRRKTLEAVSQVMKRQIRVDFLRQPSRDEPVYPSWTFGREKTMDGVKSRGRRFSRISEPLGRRFLQPKNQVCPY
jgi:hypothetical protein